MTAGPSTWSWLFKTHDSPCGFSLWLVPHQLGALHTNLSSYRVPWVSSMMSHSSMSEKETSLMFFLIIGFRTSRMLLAGHSFCQICQHASLHSNRKAFLHLQVEGLSFTRCKGKHFETIRIWATTITFHFPKIPISLLDCQKNHPLKYELEF